MGVLSILSSLTSGVESKTDWAISYNSRLSRTRTNQIDQETHVLRREWRIGLIYAANPGPANPAKFRHKRGLPRFSLRANFPNTSLASRHIHRERWIRDRA